MTTHDWRALDIEGVTDVILQAASKVARHYELEVEDLVQEATIMVADTEGSLYWVLDHLGLLQYRLEQQLVMRARTTVRQRDKNESYEVRYQDGEDGDSTRPALRLDQAGTSQYTRELVEALLPAVWDSSYAYGMQAENAPDQDMPRGTVNKATGNTLAAHLADIRRAWELTELTPAERRVLCMTYGLDWPQVGSPGTELEFAL